jgi:hypothetical protein
VAVAAAKFQFGCEETVKQKLIHCQNPSPEPPETTTLIESNRLASETSGQREIIALAYQNG